MNIHNLRWIHGGILFALLLLLFPTSVFADSKLPEIQAGSFFMMEFESGAVLAEENADVPLSPASMTKMMTEYIILEKIKEGKIGWNDMVTVSPHAASLGGAQVYLKEGEKRNVEELFAAMAIHSANDATVALAEYVAGDETSFVHLMNDKAKEFGLTNTHFINSTGLSKESYENPPQIDGKHVMSARDAALLAQRLLLDFPEVIDTTAATVYTFRPGEPGQMRLINTNWMLPGLEYAYEGTDGFKTGYTKDAGYCFTGTTERDGMRLITVVMKTESSGQRFQETIKLMDYGFENYKLTQLIPAGKEIPGYKTAPVVDGVETEVGISTVKPIRLPLPNGEKKDAYSYRVTLKDELQAPLKKGTIVGEVEVLYNGKKIPGTKPIPLAVTADVEKGSWLRLAFRDTNEWLASTFGYSGWPLLGQQVLSVILLLLVLIGGVLLILFLYRKKLVEKRLQLDTVPSFHQESADSTLSQVGATTIAEEKKKEEATSPIRVSLDKEPLPEQKEMAAKEDTKALFLGELKTEEDLKKELESLSLQPEESTELTPSTIENVGKMKEKEATLDTEEGVEKEKTLTQEDAPKPSLEPEETLEKEQDVKPAQEESLSEEQKDGIEASESDATNFAKEETEEMAQSEEDSPADEEVTKEKQETSFTEKEESQTASEPEKKKQHDHNKEEDVKQHHEEKGKFTWVVKQPDGIGEEKEESDPVPKEEESNKNQKKEE